MNIQKPVLIRKHSDRGYADYGWLQARYTFSFGEYQNPDWPGFSHLLVINNDTVQPKGGFPTHSHRDMEILTYVLEGNLEHKDSMGNGAVIQQGDFQKMSAGTGVRHSEFNPSDTEPVSLYQIWIQPDTTGLTPGYQHLKSGQLGSFSGLALIASSSNKAPIHISQNAHVYCGRISAGRPAEWICAENRACWIQVTRGNIAVNGCESAAGDGVYTHTPQRLQFTAYGDAEFLLFDLENVHVR